MKALALFSGGLDSTLAIKIILEQGIEVIALNFKSPFCCCERSKGCGSSIKKMADTLGVEFKMVYLGKDYLEMIKNPKHGYGRNLNPCIDCRILKFKKAKEIMKQTGASFLLSGEVLGQRPMSQHRAALKTIESEAELEGLILRPLSAKLFKETIAESKGWVDRDKLLNISGRGRRPQIDLAHGFGIKDYPCPAGGCLLTDSTFSTRLKDLFKFEDLDISDANLLRVGRHFRIDPKFKLIVGRDEKENNRLLQFANKDHIIFEPLELAGPLGIGKFSCNEQIKNKCAEIIARYTDINKKVAVKVFSKEGKEEIIEVSALSEEKLELLRV